MVNIPNTPPIRNGKKYLTIERFNEWKDNDFNSLRIDISKVRGQLHVLVPLMITVLGILVAVACRSMGYIW